MELETREEAILYSSQYDLPVTSEGGGEYTMPDYYPEIRRVVSVQATALPDSKFLSGNLLEFGGTLAFSVLYIGDDGSLCCAPYACEYSGNCQLPGEVRGGGAVIHVETWAESPGCRVLAPRTLSLKARLRSRVTADEAVVYACRTADTDGERVGPADLATLEKLTGTVDTVQRGYASATGSVTGELRERPGTAPISCSGTVQVADTAAGKDVLKINGEICIHLIALGADGLYTPIHGRIPFTEELMAEGAAEGDRVAAWGRVASVSVQADSDTGVLHVEAEYDLTGIWMKGSTVTVTRDAYSTAYDAQTHHTDIGVLRQLCCENGALTLSGSSQRQSAARANDYLIDITANPVVEKVEWRDRRPVFSGNCAIKAYIASDGDVVCEEFVIPLKYEARTGEGDAPQDILWQTVCSVTDASGRLDGDRISAVAELCVAAHAVERSLQSPVSEVVLDRYAKHEDADATVRVCFPEPGQCLWDIAKRCRADATEAERINRIPRGSACDGKPLIIR